MSPLARRPGRIYAIADVGFVGAARLPETVESLADAGIETIQLRAKALSDRELLEVADRCRVVLEGWSGTFWVNDRPDLALLAGADGVHLGQGDAPVDLVDRAGGEELLVGRSTHDASQLDEADRERRVDWIAAGPVFETASKPDHETVLGTDRLRDLRARTGKPLVAIGGIDASNLDRVLDAGADSAAILSGLLRGDVAANARRLVALAARWAA